MLNDVMRVLEGVPEFIWQCAIMGTGLLFVVILIWLIVITARFNRLTKRNSGYDLVKEIDSYYTKVCGFIDDYDSKEERLKRLEEGLFNTHNKIGIVRYNAFGDSNYGFSFSLAVLNSHNNGYVINSIYGRETSNIYIKKITRGSAETKITDEERLAMDRAMANAEWEGEIK